MVSAIPAVAAILGTALKQGNSTHAFPESLLAALTEAYRKAPAIYELTDANHGA